MSASKKQREDLEKLMKELEKGFELKIGNVVLKDVVNENDVYYYKNKKKRGKVHSERFREWDEIIPHRTSLYKLLVIYEAFKTVGIRPSQLDRPLLIDFISQYLGIRRDSCYGYTSAISYLRL